ncbi:squalene/phytoene synthase family protein [Limibaculum sp. FT325]|uniref:squalene/phytoene synthase family protein n=1 Tax=Thermohalobaculum sediminis TaxID=2939436 RepID=UPI0020BE62FD|nr:squalene/phytoene synthase family protein [Limibaculum sediminis]MCL5775538.1 squalene/phytoene synthase family protein [Limibaculum sediminis]
MTAGGLDALAPLPSDAPDPAAEVARITRAAGSSFGPGMAILPRARREGMWALYAFSRVIDDIADEDWPLADKHRLLDAWRGEIAALYAGRPVSAIGRALAAPVARYDLPQAEFLALIEGMQMDADGPIVAPPMATLRLYTRRVAGAVGMLSMRIFGAWRGEVSERFAAALGDALQLTNILRDVEEDAALGRLYLPREMLEQHGMPTTPEGVVNHPALPALGSELGALARAEFDTARGLVAAHDRLRLAPALMMMGVYEAYLNRMAARGFARARVTISKPSKLLAGVSCVLSPARSRRDA